MIVPRIVAGLKHFRHRRHEVIVFHILDPAEVDFPFRQTTLFKGLEGLADVLTEPHALRKAYQEELSAYLTDLKKNCRMVDIDYVPLRTDADLDVASPAIWRRERRGSDKGGHHMRIDRPEHYFRAGLERMDQAWVLYERGKSYALAMYVAGLATECILRAFKLRRDPVFDERHDLLLLFRASGMLDVDPETIQHAGLSHTSSAEYFRELQAAVNIIYSLWGNDYRFASEERLRAHVKRLKLDRGIKGDTLKYNALKLIKSAQLFRDRGVLQWSS